jgi:DNA-directed RNA polymerase specialized sigma24 family protein
MRYGPLEPVQPRLLREEEGASGLLQIEAYILVRRFQALPEQERIALALFYLEMFSVDQIAELMEMTLEKLARTLQSARSALKAAVEDAGAPAFAS